MHIDFAAVNWLAVLVVAVVGFLIGGTWYAGLFGKAWLRLHKYEGNEALLAEMAKTQGRTFGIFFIGYLVMAVGMALLLTGFDAPTWRTGLTLGFLAWLAVGLPENAIQNAAHRKPFAAAAIDASHQLAYLLAAGLILGAWR